MSKSATFRFLTLAALLGIFATGLAFLALRSTGPSGAIEIILPKDQAPREFVVYVTGAVATEGVYTLREGDRIVDSVEAAGGLTPAADGTAVNLAQRLVDGEHVHIPLAGEGPVAPAGSSRLVNLNTASQDQLETLPGIGPTRASAIIAHRSGNGSFARVEDLLLVEGIGAGTLASIRDLVVVR